MTLKLFTAYVKILVSLIFFLLVIMLFFSNAGNTCSNLQFFTKTYNDVSLAKLMLTCCAVGAIAVFMAWQLFTGGSTLHRYRKTHPASTADQPCRNEDENLYENK
ncbi:MAG TPA: hypothetical protein PKK48_04480 [Phycisphaerae bacterium]|nr:hypothetical protein [Phycisphaerae bacterium]HPS52599.1 hypothetical protein [Phycisphaerae bacterium]